MPLPILYQDDYLVAIHKPAGLLVHRTEIARGQDETFVVQLLRDQIGQYVYPLHRLDRPTSGVLLLAIDPDANRQLKEDFTERRVTKRYIALVRGWLEGPGEIDYGLAKPEFDRRKARKKRERGEVAEKQPAVTTFKPLDTAELPIPVGRYEISPLYAGRAQPQNRPHPSATPPHGPSAASDYRRQTVWGPTPQPHVCGAARTARSLPNRNLSKIYTSGHQGADRNQNRSGTSLAGHIRGALHGCAQPNNK